MKMVSRSLLWLVQSGFILLLASLTLLLQVETSFAASSQNQQSESNQNISSQEREYELTLRAALKAATQGPAIVPLINQGSLSLPENYLFIPKNEATAFMKANGNTTRSEFVGLIISKVDDLRWFITVNFIKSGFLRDGDAKDWTADNLMKSLKEGNDEANKKRVASGFSPLEIVGWVETPKYDASTHRLVWSMLAQHKDSGSEPVVNYNTYVLGREGYFKLNLVTDNSSIAEDKFIAHKILASLHYNDGMRYEDFNEGTDRVAEYGLAALITGVAAKKLGLLALAGAFFVKMWKLIFVVPVLLWGMIKKLFGHKDNTSVETSEK